MAIKLPTKRFKARYGRKPRSKFAAIEILQHANQKFPQCNKISVRRLAAGIWQCRKCTLKFAGKAYTLQ